MSRIADAFAACRARSEAALVTYVTAGDPDVPGTRAVLGALGRGGADVVELGMPFSDPSADGPVIQRASQRALAAGTRFDDVLGLVRDLRAGRIDGAPAELPVVLFGYLNPLLARGEKLAAELADAGVDGVLVVDLPPEEAGELGASLAAAGIDLIRLLAPTTPEARIRRVGEGASGFLYYVSMTGVTGAKLDHAADLAPRVETVRGLTGLPVGVGFGIAGPEQAAEVAAFADGVVVGSAIVRLVEAGGAGVAPEVEGFVRALKTACGR